MKRLIFGALLIAAFCAIGWWWVPFTIVIGFCLWAGFLRSGSTNYTMIPHLKGEAPNAFKHFQLLLVELSKEEDLQRLVSNGQLYDKLATDFDLWLVLDDYHQELSFPERMNKYVDRFEQVFPNWKVEYRAIRNSLL